MILLTVAPLTMFPPNSKTIESDTALESRRKTEFTLIFSLKTSHGYGILGSRALTEFCHMMTDKKFNP